MTTKNTETVEHKDLQDLSFFDVKEVYDLAYEQKDVDEVQFHALLAQAVKMDLAYRRQLRNKSSHKAGTKTTDAPKTLNKALKELISDKPTQVA